MSLDVEFSALKFRNFPFTGCPSIVDEKKTGKFHISYCRNFNFEIVCSVPIVREHKGELILSDELSHYFQHRQIRSFARFKTHTYVYMYTYKIISDCESEENYGKSHDR